MKSRISWFLAGATTVIVLGAVGSAVGALRRGCALADDEAAAIAPQGETFDDRVGASWPDR